MAEHNQNAVPLEVRVRGTLLPCLRAMHREATRQATVPFPAFLGELLEVCAADFRLKFHPDLLEGKKIFRDKPRRKGKRI